jgi:FkbM family methyltransferase
MTLGLEAPAADLCTLRIEGDVRVVVLNSLERITPYVLAEQQDWFEDEIRFLRALLRPGDRVIDIGANHGVYALSMARSVGPGGRVWAFEPATDTAATLAAGVRANRFEHVTVDRRAVSAAAGNARLSLHAHAELNALLRDAAPSAASEAVEVTTLDACGADPEWHRVDFLKIDAEGEEGRIVTGGARFLAEQSPLVQFEVKSGERVDLRALDALVALGYSGYRLVPGLDALVPFDPGERVDGYLLNLFACKPDRARALGARSLLVEREVLGEASRSGARSGAPGRDALIAALDEHARSRDPSLDVASRFCALDASLQRLLALCSRDASRLRLATLARVAREHGARSVAVAGLQQLTQRLAARSPLDTHEPYLSPEPRFDGMEQADDDADRLLAATLEAFERLGSFSSFYSGPRGEPRLALIETLGFGSAEMGRRLELTRRRLAASPGTEPPVPASMLAA